MNRDYSIRAPNVAVIAVYVVVRALASAHIRRTKMHGEQVNAHCCDLQLK